MRLRPGHAPLVLALLLVAASCGAGPSSEPATDTVEPSGGDEQLPYCPGPTASPDADDLTLAGQHVCSLIVDEPAGESFSPLRLVAAVGADDRIFVAGTFNGVVSFGDAMLVAPQAYGAFVAEIDADCGVVWTHEFDGSDVAIDAIDATADGGVIVGLRATGDIFVAGESYQLQQADWAFLVKLSADGQEEWATVHEDWWALDLGAVAGADDGTIILSGTTQGALEILPSPRDPDDQRNGVVAGFDAAGSLLWSHELYTTGGITTVSLTLSAAGGIAVGGWLTGDAFLPGGDDDSPFTSDSRAFAQTFASDGTAGWATFAPGKQGLWSLEYDADGGLVFAIDGWWEPVGGCLPDNVIGSLRPDGSLDRLQSMGYFELDDPFGNRLRMEKVVPLSGGALLVAGQTATVADLDLGPVGSDVGVTLLLAWLDEASRTLWNTEVGQAGESGGPVSLEVTNAGHAIVTGVFTRGLTLHGEAVRGSDRSGAFVSILTL